MKTIEIQEARKSVCHLNIHVFDSEREYIVTFLGDTSARLKPCSGGPMITVAREEIAEYLGGPREGKCDCCGRMTRSIVADKETGMRVFRHHRCESANWGAL